MNIRINNIITIIMDLICSDIFFYCVHRVNRLEKASISNLFFKEYHQRIINNVMNDNW